MIGVRHATSTLQRELDARALLLFSPEATRPIELITIQSHSKIFLRSQGDWINHPHKAEVLENLPELVIFGDETQSAYDLVDLSERENRPINSAELKLFVKFF
jgi:hypothetical protein